MSLHDEYARVTPYELAFPDTGRAEALVASVEEEAEGRGVPLDDPTAFLTLGAVDAFVRDVAGGDPDPTALHQYGPLAFHLVRFQKAGAPLYLMSTHVARYLVEGAPEGDPVPPSAAGYLQLPQHLFWTGAAGESPESVDGVLWSATGDGILHAMLVTGIRPDRPGMGVVPLPPAPLRDAAGWLDLDGREEGDDFATDLPGAEIDALYGLETAGELLKLLARFFAYLDGAPSVLQEVRREAGAAEESGAGEAGAADETDASGPRPSELAFSRVTLGGP